MSEQRRKSLSIAVNLRIFWWYMPFTPLPHPLPSTPTGNKQEITCIKFAQPDEVFSCPLGKLTVRLIEGCFFWVCTCSNRAFILETHTMLITTVNADSGRHEAKWHVKVRHAIWKTLHNLEIHYNTASHFKIRPKSHKRRKNGSENQIYQLRTYII